ncbi:MAG: SUMF1/EgtB/PvdO family nonheme iron enzyme [Anaerolineales bacterium]|nr:SUMF1/EgtB/PvdO family nonheme iron enzyme [Anaerolineales bacterium]
MSIKNIFFYFSIFLFFVAAGLVIGNLDIVSRSWRAAFDGRLTMQKLRFELAAFDLGRPSPNIPLDTKTSEMDGMPQVYVAEGIFIMGSNDDPQAKEFPAHGVHLDAFWMDKFEVSNAMYTKCVDAGVCLPPVLRLNPYYGKWAYRNLPVVYTNWYAAETYCAWAGRRLPTEAEWEKAARGTDQRRYTWGEDRPNPRLANFEESLMGEMLPVFRYPLGASPYGALNMAGNVREWVADWYAKDYYANSPKVNPTGQKADSNGHCAAAPTTPMPTASPPSIASAMNLIRPD